MYRLSSFVFITLFFIFSSQLFAQTYKLKGKVLNLIKQPLEGVTVILKEPEGLGTYTEADGSFELNVPKKMGVLTFMCIGYADKDVPFVVGKPILVEMAEIGVEEEEVVVVAYGSQKKVDLTGAVGTVKNEEMKNQPVANFTGAIQGKLTGVNASTASGTPGAGLSVSVRGSSNPLYVVDGIPLLSESNSQLSTSFDTEGNEVGKGQDLSSLADINPNDVESISVLKDASASSLYGARAANGVILVVTKKGTSTEKTQFNVNFYSGTQVVSHPIKMMNNDEYRSLIEDARQQDLKILTHPQDTNIVSLDPNYEQKYTILTKPLPSSWYSSQNTNWLNEIFRSASILNAELSMRGGDEKTKFYVSGGFFNQPGIIIQSSYNRVTTHINLEHQISQKFLFGINTNLTHAMNHRSFNDNTYTGILTNAIGASPFMPVYDANGNYSNFENYQSSWLSDNPIKSANEIKAYTQNNRLLTSLYGEYEFSPAFKFKSSWSIDYTNLIDDIYFSPITIDAQTVNGKAKRNNFDQTIWLAENIFTYKKTFQDKHSVNVTFGNTLQNSKANFSSISGQGFPMGSGLQNVGSASILTKGTAYKDTWALSSYIARANYSFLGKYLFSLSARLDGSSRFERSNRWGLFPAVSAGWRINQEKFFPEIRWISDLKLRGSYGYTGDQNEIGNFQYKAYWQPTQYNGQSGLIPRNLANPNLGWQRNNMMNLGLDFELFRGILYGTLEYYVSNKTKLLADATIPATSGFNTLTQNSGKIQNSGCELNLNYNVIHNKSVSWVTNINISQLKSIVKDWVQDSVLLYGYLDLAPTHIIVKGQPFGSFWGAKFVGVNPQNGDALFENREGKKVTASEITPADYQIIGKAQPTFFGGWNNTLKYKKWDFLLACSFSIGNQVYNLIRPVYQNGGWANEGWDSTGSLQQTFANNAKFVKKRWRKEGDITNIPRASLLTKNYIDNSSMFLENASFFRIRTLNVGYNLIFKNKKMGESVRIYAQAQNLLLLTKYTGYDPEVSANGSQSYYTPGIDYATYPQAKTFTLGFNYIF